MPGSARPGPPGAARCVAWLRARGGGGWREGGGSAMAGRPATRRNRHAIPAGCTPRPNTFRRRRSTASTRRGTSPRRRAVCSRRRYRSARIRSHRGSCPSTYATRHRRSARRDTNPCNAPRSHPVFRTPHPRGTRARRRRCERRRCTSALRGTFQGRARRSRRVRRSASPPGTTVCSSDRRNTSVPTGTSSRSRRHRRIRQARRTASCSCSSASIGTSRPRSRTALQGRRR
jgi:hypothetical protein